MKHITFSLIAIILILITIHLVNQNNAAALLTGKLTLGVLFIWLIISNEPVQSKLK